MTSRGAMVCASAVDAEVMRPVPADRRRFSRLRAAGALWVLLLSRPLHAAEPSAPAEPPRAAAAPPAAAPPAGPAPSPELSARLVCPRRPTPGRVVCEAELEIQAGTIAWGDVLVLAAPAFAPPLRARVGPSALFMQSERRQRLQLALAATSAGSGLLRVRARAVVCDATEREACRPAVREAEAVVDVGPITR